MHLVVPFAAAASEGCRAAMGALRLPHLAPLLAQLSPGSRDVDEETSLSAPHERALGRALGLAAADGQWPLAALERLRQGLPLNGAAWGLLSPSHWRLGTEQVSMLDPDSLGLDEHESQAFLESARALFESEGLRLEWAAPTRWHVAHESLAQLPCASLDRVVGRNVDPWLPADPRARLMRRLQNEVQMLWHTHPLNEAREARGLPTVNSVWLWGCGRGEALPAWPAGLVVDERLRGPALAEDWSAWQDAFESLDAGPVAQMQAAARRGEPVRLTLCGERAAVDFGGPVVAGGWRALVARLSAGLPWKQRGRTPLAVLEAL